MPGEQLTTHDLIELVSKAHTAVLATRLDGLDARLSEGLAAIVARQDRDADERRRERNEDRERYKDLERTIDHNHREVDARLRPLERLADRVSGGWGLFVVVVAVLGGIAGTVVSILTVVRAVG